MTDELPAPLQPYRVIALSGRSGALGTRLLAGLGAEVIRVEPPGGDPLRRAGTLYGDPGLPDEPPTSLLWYQMNAATKSVVLDLETSAGRDRFATLLERADVLFESDGRDRLERAGFAWETLHGRYPDLVYTTISPFGLDGPRSHWKGGDLVAMAAGGLLSICGDPDRAPLRPTVEQASAQGALQAVVGTLVALRARGRGAAGQRVDVSMQEAITNTLGNAHLFYFLLGVVDRRAGGGRASGSSGTRLIYPCADGHVAYLRSPATIPLMHAWMVDEGFEPGFDPDAWSGRNVVGKGAATPEEARALEARFEAFFAGREKMDLYEEGQRRGTQLCPVATIPDILANRQLRAREYFRDVEHPEWGRAFRYPGAPFRMSASSWRSGPAAPSPGRHQELLAGPSADSTRASGTPPTPAARSTRTASRGHAVDSRDILKGIRVIDFSWVGVGPRATRELAFYGAEVIRVESSRRLETFRNSGPLAPGVEGPDRSAYFANQNLDKLGITLDLAHPRAGEVVRRLVGGADIVTESFKPGTMRRHGFSYEALRRVKPDVIMISMSMEGQGGPHEAFTGFGLVLQATAGITALTGWPDRAPVGTGVAYTDWFATHLAVTAMLCALEHRDRTGEGQYVDLSQLEATIWGLDDAVLRFTALGEVARPLGNRHPGAVPHGVFPCQGEDAWCAIAVTTDDEWAGLRAAMGRPAWAEEPALASLPGRKAAEDDIEQRLAAWTAAHDAGRLAALLQDHGVPAYPVNDTSGIAVDPQLAARGHFWEIEHPVIGPFRWDGPAYRLSETPAYSGAPAPMLGQHNEHVFREILGYTDEEFVDLVASGVLE